MKLRIQFLANYASQIYMTLINLAVVPVYQRYMGAEAYGLVGFYSTLFTLFFLLDFGLALLVQRETARYQAGALKALEYRQLFRVVAVIFWTLGALGVLGLSLSGQWLAEHWFHIENLDPQLVSAVVVLMAIAVGLRWLCGLYRGVVSGTEKMVWLASFNAVVATFRFAGVLVCMWWLGFTIEVFFVFQLVVALLELLVLAAKAYSLMPRQAMGMWTFKPLRSLLQFGLVGALAAVLNVLYVQMDRLLLSGLLPLSEYGNYSLVVLVATSVMVVSVPISSVILPRMSRLFAQGKHGELQSLYRLGTRLTSTIGGGGGIVLAFFAEPVLLAWTGNAELAAEYWPVLSCYALGYGCLALAYFPYYLEAASGKLVMYFWGCLVLTCIQLPAVVVAARLAGGLGAGLVWLGLASFYLLAWGGVVHHRLIPGQHLRWLAKDVALMNWPVLLGLCLFMWFAFEPGSRLQAAAYCAGGGGGLLLLNGAWLAWTERASWRHKSGV